MISGGTAHNITAKDCRFGMDFRAVPGEDSSDWRDAYFTKCARSRRTCRRCIPMRRSRWHNASACPHWCPKTAVAAEGLARQLTGDNGSMSSATAPRRGSSRRAAIRPWSAGRAISRRRTSPTNTSSGAVRGRTGLHAQAGGASVVMRFPFTRDLAPTCRGSLLTAPKWW